MNDRLSTDSPFTVKPVKANYPPRPNRYRDVVYFEHQAVPEPTRFRCALPDGTLLEAESHTAIQNKIRVALYSLPVLLYPQGIVKLPGSPVPLSPQMTTNPEADLRWCGSDDGGQWWPIPQVLIDAFQTAKSLAIPKHLDTETGEVF